MTSHAAIVGISLNKPVIVSATNILESVKDETVFKKEAPKMWVCRNCGHIHYGEEAPAICPVCAHPKAYFELKAENY